MLYDKQMTKLVCCPGGKRGEFTIPASVTEVGDGAFSGCKGLPKIIIPPSVTGIGEWAFSDCTGLTEMTVPPSVTSIGKIAFVGCKELTRITIPPSVTSIGAYAFDGCDMLIIYGQSGSYIEQYAKENHVPFIAE